MIDGTCWEKPADENTNANQRKNRILFIGLRLEAVREKTFL